MSINQAYLFYIFLLTGILIGLVFDIFRILRKSFKTSDFITILQDILFFLFSSFLITYSLYKFNNGEVRSFVIVGLLSGIIIYFLTFSKVFIKINIKIIEKIKKIVKLTINIILYPFRLIFIFFKKTFFKPVCFILINLHKKINFKTKFAQNKKKIDNKEGF